MRRSATRLAAGSACPQISNTPSTRRCLRRRLDAVLVGTPHTLHYEQVVAALDRGHHVYCDKPLTTDLERARDLADRVDRSDRTVMVGYQRHLQTAFRTARDRFADRPPEWLTASITQGVDRRFARDLAARSRPVRGGFLYDTGSHVLDGVLWTTGLEPASVAASMAFYDDEQRVDRRAHLDVRFENGATGTFSFHGDAPSVREHIHLWDEEGAIYLEGTQWGPERSSKSIPTPGSTFPTSIPAMNGPGLTRSSRASETEPSRWRRSKTRSG